MSLQTSASADVVYYIFATLPSSSYHHTGSYSNILAFGLSFWVLEVTIGHFEARSEGDWVSARSGLPRHGGSYLDRSSVKGTPFTSRNPIAISSRPIFGLNHFGSYMHKL